MVKPLGIKVMKNIALQRGGICLSNEYINIYTKLKFKCKEGHIWKTVPANIKAGNWCPKCQINISERISKCYFEKLFDKKFPKKRPKWLKSPKGFLMELDGYNK